jgi:hypothetical protein
VIEAGGMAWTKLFVNNFTVYLDKKKQRCVIERVKYNPYTRAKVCIMELLKEAYCETGFKPLQTLEHSPYVTHEVLEKMHLNWENEFCSFRDNKFRNQNDLLVPVSATKHLLFKCRIVTSIKPSVCTMAPLSTKDGNLAM